MMTYELRYLLKTNSDHEVCNDQRSLGDLLTDLRALAEDLELDFGGAYLKAGILFELHDQSPFCPSI